MFGDPGSEKHGEEFGCFPGTCCFGGCAWYSVLSWREEIRRGFGGMKLLNCDVGEVS